MREATHGERKHEVRERRLHCIGLHDDGEPEHANSSELMSRRSRKYRSYIYTI